MKDIYQDNNTNFPSPASPLPNETNNSSIILDTPPTRAYQQKSSQNRNNNKHINDKNSNNHRYTDTSQTTRLEHDTNPVNKTATNQEPQRNNKVTPKKEIVNNTNINASCSQSRNDDTSRDQATIIYTRKEKLMDIDVDEIKPSWNDNIDTEVNACHQDNFNTVELTHNPWSNNTTPIVITSNRQQDPVLEFKSVLDLRPNISFDSVVQQAVYTPTPDLTHTSVVTKNKDEIELVETIDNSRHAPSKCRNSRTQTFDCRVLASEIPGVSRQKN